MANYFEEKPVDEWNVNDMIRYADELHQELFGVPYEPMRGWQAERGIVSQAIGTQKRKGKYDKKVFKRFIEYTFKTYKPTQQYPGTSIMFMYTYRKSDLQRITLEVEQERKENELQSKQSDGVDEEILDWFGN